MAQSLAKNTRRERLPGAERRGGKLRAPHSRGGRWAPGPCPSTRLPWGREMDSVSLAIL